MLFSKRKTFFPVRWIFTICLALPATTSAGAFLGKNLAGNLYLLLIHKSILYRKIKTFVSMSGIVAVGTACFFSAASARTLSACFSNTFYFFFTKKSRF